MEVPDMNTSTPTTRHPTQQQDIKAQEEPQQDSEEEIEAIIEDELVRLRHENECLQLMQEQMARINVIAKRAQIMQQ
jgi:hypothetical protein